MQKEDDPNLPSQMVYFGSTSKIALEEFFCSVYGADSKPAEYTWPDYLGTLRGGRHMSDTEPRKPGAPTSAADLAARFKAHRLGQQVADAVSGQAHLNLSPTVCPHHSCPTMHFVYRGFNRYAAVVLVECCPFIRIQVC